MGRARLSLVAVAVMAVAVLLAATGAGPEGSPPGADVQLAVVEPRHGMAIGHGAYLHGPAGTLLTSLPGAHPATATLKPPRPGWALR
jgi:hypothetical protein